MPTYNYKCEECENVFEDFHSIKETVEECPECGGSVHKYFGKAPSIQFKGDGFYINDSKEDDS
jgi:putative FmdB family regulatory protein